MDLYRPEGQRNDPLQNFILERTTSSDLGVIVFGSYYRRRFELHLELAKNEIRDIDLIVVKSTSIYKHELIEVGGIHFDVHELSLDVLYQYVFVNKNLMWIRNIFSSHIVESKSEPLLQLYKKIRELRGLSPRNFFDRQKFAGDLLVLKNYSGKLLTSPFDIVSFSHFFYVIAFKVYYWKCLAVDVWPSAHPQFVRQDIAKRFPTFEALIRSIESAEPEAKAQLVAHMLKTELPEAPLA